MLNCFQNNISIYGSAFLGSKVVSIVGWVIIPTVHKEVKNAKMVKTN